MLKRFVYVLKNGEALARHYTGVTSDVANRLASTTQATVLTLPDTARGPSTWSLNSPTSDAPSRSSVI